MRRRMKRFNTYGAYTVGCVVAWAIFWVVVGTQASDHTRRTLLYVFLGWLIGWTSATIARAVYPPPSRKAKLIVRTGSTGPPAGRGNP
jgi:hypothetical protein